MSTEAQALLDHIAALLREGRRIEGRIEEGPAASRVEVWIEHGRLGEECATKAATRGTA